MSSANAAAKKRRTSTLTSPPMTTSYSQSVDNVPPRPQTQSPGLTLPQVIALIDSRLSNLEKNAPNQEFIEESSIRCEILAEEISKLKEIVLSLQSYTMGVNKILMEEKLNIINNDNDNDEDDDDDDNGQNYIMDANVGLKNTL